MLLENPFTPTFGEIPVVLAGRELIVSDLVNAFDRKGRSPDLTTLISGARGTGKTALLAVAAEKAEERGWIAVRVPALPGMLDEILDRAHVSARHILEKEGAKLSSIGVGSFISLGWDNPDRENHTWATNMSLLLDELAESGTGLLILVDEIRSDLDELVRLVATYQQFVGERRRIGLIMAGIPYQVSSLLNDQSASFLRRAQILQLGRIDDFAVADALRKTVESGGRAIDPDAVEIATKGIDGFAFMLQLVGYRMWDASPDAPIITADHASTGVARALAEMSDRVLEATWRELSDGDIAFLKAMLPDKDESKMKDISERMGKPGSYTSSYRKRLLMQGVIGERRRGSVGFELPGFKAFLKEKIEEAES